MIWLEFAWLTAPVVTTTSIILWFNKHRLTQIHLEKWPLNVQREREILILSQCEPNPVHQARPNHLTINDSCSSVRLEKNTRSVLKQKSEWVSRAQRPHQHITRHFGDESFHRCHLHWYWQHNQINQETEHIQAQNYATQKVAQVNTIIHTQKQPRLTHRTDRAWFSYLLQHPARKQRDYSYNPECTRGLGAYGYDLQLLKYIKQFTRNRKSQ